MPHSIGRRLPLRALHLVQAVTTLSQVFAPPREIGLTWSRVSRSRRFRSERAEYPYPLVIRLVKYVEIPRRLRKHVTNAILFARDNYRCQYCSRHRNDLGRRDRLTRDHVKPISRGGTNSWDNVVTACTKCNARKGNRLPMECGMYPKSTPKEPRYVVMVWYSRDLNEVQRRYVDQFYGGLTAS